MKFSKMQAAGNDFIVVSQPSAGVDWGTLARKWCDRHTGIGADGLIVVSGEVESGIRMRMFNPDGSEAESCGNGLRCTARYAVEAGMVNTIEFKVATLAGETLVKVAGAARGSRAIDSVTVSMIKPIFDPIKIPVSLPERQTGPVLEYPLRVMRKNLFLSFVSMGNPHAVAFIRSAIDDFPLEKIGPLVENNAIFPRRTNFEIARVASRRAINARVWERGAGETLACGTGACAIAVSARLKGLVDSPVDIILPGGKLTIQWSEGERVMMTGPVVEVYKGEIAA